MTQVREECRESPAEARDAAFSAGADGLNMPDLGYLTHFTASERAAVTDAYEEGRKKWYRRERA